MRSASALRSFGATAFAVIPAALRGLACRAEARFRGSPGGRRLVGLSRFELLTPRLSSVCSNQLSYRPQVDLLEPLSKNPAAAGKPRAAACPPRPEGEGGILSKLDRTCAHPREYQIDHFQVPPSDSALTRFVETPANSRKEVIQPQVLLQLPCYDFTPITDHTLGACLPCGLARRLLVQPAFVM